MKDGTLVAANASGTSATGTGTVTVGNDAATGLSPTLAGAGFIGGTVIVDGDNAGAGSAGRVAPGAIGAVGTLTVGGLTLKGGSILHLKGNVLNGFDLIEVTGADLLTCPYRQNHRQRGRPRQSGRRHLPLPQVPGHVLLGHHREVLPRLLPAGFTGMTFGLESDGPGNTTSTSRSLPAEPPSRSGTAPPAAVGT